jgi:UPF0755 protein
MNIPVKLAFNNQERVENFAGRVGSQIEADSLSLLTSFKDSIFLKENGFTKENVLVMFIPNTYEFYWNTTADKFRDKMIKEYLWDKERVAKEQQGLTSGSDDTCFDSAQRICKKKMKDLELPEYI